MKTATVSDLHDHLDALLGEVESGERVEVTRDGQRVALIIPATPTWPDFMARLKEIYPDGPVGKPLSEIVDEGRGDRP